MENDFQVKITVELKDDSYDTLKEIELNVGTLEYGQARDVFLDIQQNCQATIDAILEKKFGKTPMSSEEINRRNHREASKKGWETRRKAGKVFTPSAS